MILTCPACGTRYQADEAKFPPDGRMVRCAKCSHVWHQAGPRRRRRNRMSPSSRRSPSAKRSAASEPEPDIFSRTRAFAPPAAEPSVAREPIAWGAMLGVAAGWIGLIAVVLVIGYSAVTTARRSR